MKWTRSANVGSSTRKCLPQLRSATMRWPTRRSLLIRVLPSTPTMRRPTSPCASSFRMTIDGPSGMTSPALERSEHLEEAHHDGLWPAHADADEDALADPGERRRGALEARQAAEVDLGRLDRLAAHEARHHRRRRSANRVGVNVDAVAGVGLEDVARLEARHRLARDELEVGAAGKDAGAEAAAGATAADDRDDAAHAGGDLADLDRRADFDLEVGEERERRR